MDSFFAPTRCLLAWRRWWPLTLGVVAVAAVAIIGTGDLLRTIWPLTALRDAALVAVLAVAACGLGAIVAKWLNVEWHGAKGVLLRVSLGLAVASVIVFAIGLAGALNRPVLAALLVAGLTAATRATRAPSPSCGDEAGGDRRVEWALAVGIAVAAIVALRGALAPETFYDALYYQDAFPALFLRHGRVEVFDFAIHSAMPFGINMLYTPLLAWGGASTVKLAHFGFYLGSAMWVATLASFLAGRLAGRIAALLFMSIPGVAVVAGLGAIDLGITFFSVSGLALIAMAIPSAHWRPLVPASACLIGAAMGGKYSALAVGAVWGLGVLVWLLRGRTGVYGQRVRAVVIAAILVIAVGGGWYLRNWMLLGSPVFPEFSPPGSTATQVAAMLRRDAGGAAGWSEVPAVLVGVLTEARVYGAGSETWPVGLVLLPGLLWGLWRGGQGRWLSLAAIVLFIVWARSFLMLRFAYPALAIAAVLAGAAWFEIGRKQRWPVAAMLTVAVGTALLRVVGIQDVVMGEYLATGETAESFLLRRLQGFGGVEFVRNSTPAAGTRILLVGETRGYYLNRDYEPVGACNHHPLVAWVAGCRSGDDLILLLQRKGFTHVLVNFSELGRLNRYYGHCLLSASQAGVVEAALAASIRVFAEGGVAIYELPKS